MLGGAIIPSLISLVTSPFGEKSGQTLRITLMSQWTVVLLDLHSLEIYQTGYSLKKRQAMHVSEHWPVDEMSSIAIPCSKPTAEVLAARRGTHWLSNLVEQMRSRAEDVEFIEFAASRVSMLVSGARASAR